MRRTSLTREWRAREWDTYQRAQSFQRMWEHNRQRAIEHRSIAGLMIADEQVARAYEEVQRIAAKYDIR